MTHPRKRLPGRIRSVRFYDRLAVGRIEGRDEVRKVGAREWVSLPLRGFGPHRYVTPGGKAIEMDRPLRFDGSSIPGFILKAREAITHLGFLGLSGIWQYLSPEEYLTAAKWHDYIYDLKRTGELEDQYTWLDFNMANLVYAQLMKKQNVERKQESQSRKAVVHVQFQAISNPIQESIWDQLGNAK